jgi:hypothetical protein
LQNLALTVPASLYGMSSFVGYLEDQGGYRPFLFPDIMFLDHRHSQAIKEQQFFIKRLPDFND